MTEVLNEMNLAAAEAEAEMENKYKDWSAEDLALWFERWYMRAGHKRLGRILVMIAKLKRKETE